MHIERELKFGLPAGGALRAERLLGLRERGLRRRLESVYYDTPDLMLQKARAALRLRRAGREWMQTLKAERGDRTALSERAEWEIAAPGGKLDCARFPGAEVRAASGIDLARLAPSLRPIFATRFDRRAREMVVGRSARLEASLDRGEIVAGRRRAPLLELELELRSGDARELLRYAEKLVSALGLRLEQESKAERGYRLAKRAGAPPPRHWEGPRFGADDTVASALGGLCAAALAQLAANAAGAHAGRDPEYLHQLRVAARRLREALRAFRPALRQDGAKPLERRLKRLMRPLGEARDWDVFCAGLTAADDGLGPAARAAREGALQGLRSALDSRDFQVLQLRVLRWLAAPPWRSGSAARRTLAEFARERLERLDRRVRKAGTEIDWHDAAARHALRIRVKRLRYACEFFASCFSAAASAAYVERLKALQELLGELNDAAVARKLLRRLHPGGERANGRETALKRKLPRAWRSFESARPFWRPTPAPRASG